MALFLFPDSSDSHLIRIRRVGGRRRRYFRVFPRKSCLSGPVAGHKSEVLCAPHVCTRGESGRTRVSAAADGARRLAFHEALISAV